MAESSGIPNPDPEQLPQERMICYCFQVTELEIINAIKTGGLREIEEIQKATNAGMGCHSCWPDLEGLLARYGPPAPQASPPPQGGAGVLGDEGAAS